jgi:hypothetical protein
MAPFPFWVGGKHPGPDPNSVGAVSAQAPARGSICESWFKRSTAGFSGFNKFAPGASRGEKNIDDKKIDRALCQAAAIFTSDGFLSAMNGVRILLSERGGGRQAQNCGRQPDG